jgi:hypothetical protein
MALDVQPISGTPALVAARLCNFATGSPTPLASHRAWLDANVRPKIAGNASAWVDVIGHASTQWKHTHRANAHALNMALSLNRCEQVKAIVRGYEAGATFNLEIAKGDEGSNTVNQDDGYDRAVEIYVYGSKGQRPAPKPAPEKVINDKFEIRVVGGGSGSILAQVDNFFFQIVDLNRHLTAFYFYTGGGIGISIPKIPGPGSVTKQGPPTKFRTTRGGAPCDAELYMFNSKAQLFQDAGATLGGWSVGGTMRLSIDEIVDHQGMIFTKPGIIPIEGGAGIQMPGLGSATKGVLALASGIFPFNGY